MIEWEKTESGECEMIEDIPKGAKIVSINGIPVEGFCECCEVPILTGEDYSCDVEGVQVCKTCTLDEIGMDV